MNQNSKRSHTNTKRFHFFLNTHTKTAVSDKNVLGKKKKKLQEGFIPLKKKAGLYAEYQKIPNGVLPPGPSLQPSHFENI